MSQTMGRGEPVKKESPSPLARAIDTATEPRPLSPVRKYALPIGIAASLVLAGASAVAYAEVRSPERAAHAHIGLDVFLDCAKHAKTFIPPNEPTRLGGAVAPPAANPLPPAQVDVKPSPPQAHILPQAKRPRLAGDVMEPSP